MTREHTSGGLYGQSGPAAEITKVADNSLGSVHLHRHRYRRYCLLPNGEFHPKVPRQLAVHWQRRRERLLCDRRSGWLREQRIACSRASRTSTFRPALPSSIAAAKPAMPAPATITSHRSMGRFHQPDWMLERATSRADSVPPNASTPACKRYGEWIWLNHC